VLHLIGEVTQGGGDALVGLTCATAIEAPPVAALLLLPALSRRRRGLGQTAEAADVGGAGAGGDGAGGGRSSG